MNTIYQTPITSHSATQHASLSHCHVSNPAAVCQSDPQMTHVSHVCARLAAVHLVDAHLASDPAKYLAAALVSLSAMLHLELPHINVLSKVRHVISNPHVAHVTHVRVPDWRQYTWWMRTWSCHTSMCCRRCAAPFPTITQRPSCHWIWQPLSSACLQC